MSKISIDNNAFVYPMPVVLLGATVDNKANFMTVGWISRVNFNPPLIAAAINKAHHTNKGIRESKTFSVNIPTADMIEITDYCGIVSGKKRDKSELFKVFYGQAETAPMISESSLSMECRLFQIVELPTNDLFIGEIVGAYSEEKYLTDGKPDIKKMNPIALTMPDNSYWKIGELAGKAWSVGKALKSRTACKSTH
jgi:flavin reductase (DIM6/NTAB) family NADH-FMN oxidoreductase RutF